MKAIQYIQFFYMELYGIIKMRKYRKILEKPQRKWQCLPDSTSKGTPSIAGILPVEILIKEKYKIKRMVILGQFEIKLENILQKFGKRVGTNTLKLQETRGTIDKTSHN